MSSSITCLLEEVPELCIPKVAVIQYTVCVGKSSPLVYRYVSDEEYEVYVTSPWVERSELVGERPVRAIVERTRHVRVALVSREHAVVARSRIATPYHC